MRLHRKSLLPIALVPLFAAVGCGIGGPGDENLNANQKPYIKSLPPPVHLSHRGGADTAPENTVDAFSLAVDTYRTDVLEIDLHLTADGHIVVIHDAEVDRTTDGTGLVADKTLAEVQALDAAYRFDPDGDSSFPRRGQGVRIPTLDEVFRLFPGMHFNLEIKASNPPFEADLAALVETHGMEDLVCWGSSDDQSARRLRAENPNVCIYYPLGAASCFVLQVIDGADPLANCPDHYDALNLPEGSSTPEVVRAAHQLGIPVYTWTVDDPGIMTTLFGYGVDGIITDRPDLLRQVIDAR